MDKDETPELIEIKGHRVYKVPNSTIAGCKHCPLYVSPGLGCQGRYLEDGLDKFPCGPTHYFIHEDAWHKMKLQNSS